MRDLVEVFRQIGVNNVSVVPAHKPVHFLDIDRAETRVIAISTVVGNPPRRSAQHDLCSGLDNPVPDCRDTAVVRRHRDAGSSSVPPDRDSKSRDEFFAQARQPCFSSRRVGLFERYPGAPAFARANA